MAVLALSFGAALTALVLVLPDRFLPFGHGRLQRQLARLGRRPAATATAAPAPLPAFRLAARLPSRTLVRLLAHAYGERGRERFESQAMLAGLEARLSWEEFLSLKLVLPLLGAAYLALIFFNNGLDPALAVASAIPVLSFFVPDQWLFSRGRQRQSQIERELPSALTTLAITTEAGLGLAAAMEEVARTQRGVLASEFRRASDQIALGRPQGVALENMAARCGVAELTMFASMLVQSFEKGSDQVSATLRAQSQEAWAKRRRRAEELAQTASIRLFLPLVLLVFPAIVIFLLGPALMTISGFFAQGGLSR